MIRVCIGAKQSSCCSSITVQSFHGSTLGAGQAGMPAHQRRTRSVARQALGGRIGTGRDGGAALRWVPDMPGWRRSAPVCRTRRNGGSPAADALGCWVAAQRAGLRTGRDGGSPAADALGSPAADAVPDRPGWRRSATGAGHAGMAAHRRRTRWVAGQASGGRVGTSRDGEAWV